mgnify:FL=1
MDISFSQRAFQIVQVHNQEVIEDQIGGKDEIWGFLIPYGRFKSADQIGVGESTEVCTKEREIYKDRRGISKTLTYRVRRIR